MNRRGRQACFPALHRCFPTELQQAPNFDAMQAAGAEADAARQHSLHNGRKIQIKGETNTQPALTCMHAQ